MDGIKEILGASLKKMGNKVMHGHYVISIDRELLAMKTRCYSC